MEEFTLILWKMLQSLMKKIIDNISYQQISGNLVGANQNICLKKVHQG